MIVEEKAIVRGGVLLLYYVYRSGKGLYNFSGRFVDVKTETVLLDVSVKNSSRKSIKSLCRCYFKKFGGKSGYD